MEFLRNYDNVVKSDVPRKMLLRGTGTMGLKDNFVAGYPSDLQQIQNKASDRITP